MPTAKAVYSGSGQEIPKDTITETQTCDNSPCLEERMFYELEHRHHGKCGKLVVSQRGKSGKRSRKFRAGDHFRAFDSARTNREQAETLA
jgi:hypothetical protein